MGPIRKPKKDTEANLQSTTPEDLTGTGSKYVKIYQKGQWYHLQTYEKENIPVSRGSFGKPGY